MTGTVTNKKSTIPNDILLGIFMCLAMVIKNPRGRSPVEACRPRELKLKLLFNPVFWFVRMCESSDLSPIVVSLSYILPYRMWLKTLWLSHIICIAGVHPLYRAGIGGQYDLGKGCGMV